MPQLATNNDCVQVAQALSLVDSVTQQLFGSDYSRLEQEDPEVLNERYYLYRVNVRGESASLLCSYNEWHAALSDIPEDIRHLFRLSLDVQE